MKTYSKEELAELIEKHGKWLKGLKGGERAGMSMADLSGADLSGANLSMANLSGAKLSGAKMFGAKLSGADLSRADLSGADLYGANLSGANLSGANLSGANLSGANLSKADLSGADLSRANLSRANLSMANLSGAKLDKVCSDRLSIVPESGPFWGWKKVRTDTGTAIVKILIPEDAPRSNSTGRKCRAGWAVVLEGEGVSGYDGSTRYAPGLTVKANSFDPDRWKECAGGIHFFITRSEAEAYEL